MKWRYCFTVGQREEWCTTTPHFWPSLLFPLLPSEQPGRLLRKKNEEEMGGDRRMIMAVYPQMAGQHRDVRTLYCTSSAF